MRRSLLQRISVKKRFLAALVEQDAMLTSELQKELKEFLKNQLEFHVALEKYLDEGKDNVRR